MISALLTLLLSFMPMFQQTQLPDQWSQDFKISLSHSASMRGGSTQIIYTYSQCVYEYKGEDGKVTKYSFPMTEAMRNEVLNKLRTLKVDEIKSEGGIHAVNDGWSQSICFGMTCIEGGPSAEMSAEDKNKFIDAYGYLQQYALDRKSSKR